MGHLTNPIGFRIGRSQGWKSLWASSSLLYASSNNQNLVITNYMRLFFNQLLLEKVRDVGLVHSHVWIRFRQRRIHVTVFLYSGNLVKMQRRKYMKFLVYLRSKTEKKRVIKFSRR